MNFLTLNLKMYYNTMGNYSLAKCRSSTEKRVADSSAITFLRSLRDLMKGIVM